ncbi:unnamed protein product [Bathycoccus prasinos]
MPNSFKADFVSYKTEETFCKSESSDWSTLSSCFLCSSRMVNLIPLPFGKETIGLLPVPMAKTFENRVAKFWPAASVKWTTSKEPLCFSRLLTIPTRPAFLPPVTMHKAPASNLTKSVILLEAMSTMTESPSLIIGSGYRMVLESCNCTHGTPLSPNFFLITLHNLYCASIPVILCTTNRPFWSYIKRKCSSVFSISTTSMIPHG